MILQPNPPCIVTANKVAHELLIHGKATMSNKPKRPVLLRSREGMGSVVYPFSEEEYKKWLAALNNVKAAGIDDVLVSN